MNTQTEKRVRQDPEYTMKKCTHYTCMYKRINLAATWQDVYKKAVWKALGISEQ